MGFCWFGAREVFISYTVEKGNNKIYRKVFFYLYLYFYKLAFPIGSKGRIVAKTPAEMKRAPLT